MKAKIEFKVLPFVEFIEWKENLKRLPGELNRPVLEPHVEKLKTIMDQNGFDDIFKVIKTKVFSKSNRYEFYCGDGNHRLSGIGDINLNQDIPICVITLNKLQDIIGRVATWNNAGKKWTLLQYLKTWASADYEDYIQLREILKRYKYSMSPMIEAYGKEGRKYSRSFFEEGKFEIDIEKGDRIMRIYVDSILAGLNDSAGAFAAVTRFWNAKPQADEKIYFEIIQRKKSLFGGLSGRDAILTTFNEFYNKASNSQIIKEKKARLKTLERMKEENVS